MTDPFALLDQPRRPWLDPEELTRVFHKKTLRSHPDAQAERGPAAEAAFAELNEAYQVLRDPKRRLQHLLASQQNGARRVQTEIPAELEALFPRIAVLTQRLDAAIQKNSAATTALTRSLLKAESAAVVRELDEMLIELRRLHGNALEQLRESDRTWESEPANELPRLQQLYLQFSYLDRWIADLEEKRFRM
ncbi:MAG TPA: DnaJ domain-containing protein [Chthoniobacterales bacterium]